MTSNNHRLRRRTIACGVALAALLAEAPALAQSRTGQISLPAQPVQTALRDLARKTGVDILFTPEAVRGVRSAAVQGAMTPEQAARRIVAGTNLEVIDGPNGSLVVRARAGASPQPQATPAAGQPEDAPQVAEVVVTATKRAQRMQDVPGAVSVLSNAELKRNQSVRFEDYLTKIPGLNYVSSGQGTAQLILRGVTAGAAQLSSTVGVYVDEAPYGSSTVFANGAASTPDLDTSDISRIEVLKGPQGTLYGADSLGGIVKFVTTAPDPTAFSGHLSVTGTSVDGGDHGYGISGAVNLPLVQDKLALRISAYDRNDPGYVDDAGRGLTNINDASVQGGRASFLWRPTEDITIKLSALLQDLRLDNPSSEDVSVPGLASIYGDLQQRRLIDSPKRFKYRLYDATLDWDLHGASLVSSTSYSTFDYDSLTDFSQTFGPLVGGLGVSIAEPVSREKFTQELRVQSAETERLAWRAGVFFTHESSDHDQTLSLFDPTSGTPIPGTDLFVFHGPDRYTEYAGFGDLTYDFTPRFDVTVGARYSHNNQHFTEVETGPLAGPGVNFTRESSDSTTTWLVNPRFKVSEDLMLYARVATGYRPGGPTTAIPGFPAPETFDPDTVTDYELGFKATLLDRRLTLDADVFYIDWRDIQLNQNVNGFVLVANGGTARSQGAEVSATLTPLAGLNISGNVAYTDAALTEDAPGVGGVDGDRLPAVPHWNAAIDLSYDWRLSEQWDAFVGASYRYVGDRMSDFQTLAPGAPAPRFVLPSYDIADLRAGVSRGGWTVTVFAKNIGDQRGLLAIGSNTGSPVSGSFSAAVIQPRTFGVDLSAKF